MRDAGIYSTADLADLGLGDAKIRGLVKAGKLVRIRRGWYRRPLTSDSLHWHDWPIGEPEARHRFVLEAALPTLASDSVFCDVSAATLHGLPVPARLLDRAYVLRPGTGSGAISATSHRRYAPLGPGDIEEVAGLPATSLTRTVVDLARNLPFVDAVAVADAALRQGVAREALVEALAPRQPNNLQARAVLRFATPLAESAGESRCRATMKLAGIPIPTLQFKVRDEQGREIARTDYAWVDLGVVGEFDGWVKYGRLLKPGQSLEQVLEGEKRREENIRRCGWWVARWVNRELSDVDAFRSGALRTLRNGHARQR